MSIQKNSRTYIAFFASLIFLFSFCVAATQYIKIKSDAIALFSLSKDLLSNISILHWYFPGPVPLMDLLVSIPLVFILKTPVFWCCVFNFIQQLAIIFLCIFFVDEKKKISVLTRWISCTYIICFVFLLGWLIFGMSWEQAAGASFRPGFHLSTAISALFIFLLTTPKQSSVSFLKIFFMGLFSLVQGFSDVFFCYYFFLLNIPYFFIDKANLLRNRQWRLTVLFILIVSLIGVFLSYKINPGLSTELQAHSDSAVFHILPNLLGFIHVAKWQGILLVLFSPLLFLYFAIKQNKQQIVILLTGIWLIGVASILSGLLINSIGYFRYVCIYFPVFVYVLMTLLPPSFLQKLADNLIVAFCVLIVSMGYFYANAHYYKMSFFSKKLSPLITCSELKNPTKAVLVATYWPAKILFELSDRQMSLIQVQSDLQRYPWIVNPLWEKMIHRPTTVLIAIDEVNVLKINALLKLPGSRSLCQGHLIELPLNNRLLNIVPAFKEYKK